MAKTYRSKEADRLHRRATKRPVARPAQRVGEGKHAHPQPHGSQERKRKT